MVYVVHGALPTHADTGGIPQERVRERTKEGEKKGEGQRGRGRTRKVEITREREIGRVRDK